MDTAVMAQICFSEKEKPSFLTIVMLSQASAFGLAFRSEEQPLCQTGTCKGLLRNPEKLENQTIQFRSQLYLHYRTHRSIKEAATTLIALENLPCALVAEEPQGHTKHLQERHFLSFRGDAFKPSPFLTVTGCEGSACSQELHGQGTLTLLQKQEGESHD